MPSRAKVSDGSDLNLFSTYDSMATTHKVIQKPKKRERERLPPPVNGALTPTMMVDDDEDDPFLDNPRAMAEDARYMGVLEKRAMEASLEAMPWYMVITNERVREELEDMARDEFTCAECGAEVVEIENRGRWQCQMPVTWSPQTGEPGEFQKVRFMVRADHRREGAPLWSDPRVSAVSVHSSVMALMDGTARPLPEAIVSDDTSGPEADGTTKMQRAIQSQDTDARTAEQFVRNSHVILRYSAAAVRTAVRNYAFYENERDGRLRNRYIRGAMSRVFDLSLTKSRFSVRTMPSGAPLYILKKEMISA